MASTLPRAVTGITDGPPRTRRWSFVTDGPPLWLVAVIFAALLAVWLAPGAPAVLALVLGGALLLTMALEFPRWGGHLLAERSLAPSHPISLRQRLDQARLRRIQRDRWR